MYKNHYTDIVQAVYFCALKYSQLFSKTFSNYAHKQKLYGDPQ